MKNNYRYWQNSLKTRVTLITLAIFLAGIWSLSFYASRMLREDMERLLGEQQFSMASLVAADVNDQLDSRLRALGTVAGIITPAILGDKAALQVFMERLPVFQQMFNGGTFVTRIDGTAIADFPLAAGRIGLNYMDRDFMVAALKEGKSTIGRPVMGKKLRAPIIGITAPIRDAQGKVIGALTGVTNLALPSFLDKITEGRYGKTGGYVLVARQYRLIVTATDKSRIMQQLPAPGINPTIDRFIQGYEGSAVYHNSLGVEQLASAKGVPVAGWHVNAQLPTKEAFAPIHDMERRMLLATIFLTLLAGGLTWWMLRRQLLPMHIAAITLAKLSDENQPLQPLHITNQDEIGKLIGGFNHLLETVAQREEALKESEFRWKFAIDGAGDGLWDWNIADSTVFFSKIWKELLGYSEGEIGNGLDEWEGRIHPEDKADTLAAVQRHLDGKTPVYVNEHRVRCKDGSYKWILDRGMVVSRGEDGKPLRMIGTHTDITERKQMEDTLRDHARYTQAILQNVIDGIITIDSRGSIQSFNLAAERIFGYEAAEAIGNNVNMLMPEPYHSEHDGYLSNYLATGVPRIIGKDREVVGRRKDGSIFPMDLAVSQSPQQDQLVFIGLVRDITERKRDEDALIAAREEADRASKAKSEFLSSMSHELRTPMNAILGFGQLMEYDDTLADEHMDSVREILKAGQHLLELINEVLDLAKVESGHIDLSLEPVAVCPVVEECLNLVSTLASKRDIRISHSGLKGSMVRADRTRLRQVLLNLLSNAVKYNREGGSVFLKVRPEGTDRLRIMVTDTGQGIPAARLTELFHPFNRLDAENSGIEGTGIGLTITRRIVEMMGGSVDVESEVGVGSTFWIELPIETALEPDQGEAVDIGITPAQSINSAQHTVLYIEDNPSNLKLVAQILGRHKHIHLLTAHTPELGIELALARCPELILLDINMPGMDGYQVLEVFKADLSLNSIPIVAITANAMPCDVERGKAAGFSEYLTKPLDVALFHTVIDQLLSRG